MKRDLTLEDVRAIVLSEFAYWRDHDPSDEDVDIVAIGATGAAANIFAALHGHAAPWHKLADGSPAKQPEPAQPEGAAA